MRESSVLDHRYPYEKHVKENVNANAGISSMPSNSHCPQQIHCFRHDCTRLQNLGEKCCLNSSLRSSLKPPDDQLCMESPETSCYQSESSTFSRSCSKRNASRASPRFSFADHLNKFNVSQASKKIAVIRLSSWMGHPLIRQMRFWDVILPGSHNSASWCLAKNKKNRFGGLISLFLKLYIHCQDKAIVQQLRMGVRFLDIRVCKSSSHGGEVYCAHGGFRTVPLKEVLKQIVRFCTNYSSEVIVLSVRRDVAFVHGPASVSIEESDSLIFLTLNRFLGPELSKDVTIGELAARNQNILYFFEDRERYFVKNSEPSRSIDGKIFLWPSISHREIRRTKSGVFSEGPNDSSQRTTDDPSMIGELSTTAGPSTSVVQLETDTRETLGSTRMSASSNDLFYSKLYASGNNMEHLLEWSEPDSVCRPKHEKTYISFDKRSWSSSMSDKRSNGSCEVTPEYRLRKKNWRCRRFWTYPNLKHAHRFSDFNTLMYSGLNERPDQLNPSSESLNVQSDVVAIPSCQVDQCVQHGSLSNLPSPSDRPTTLLLSNKALPSSFCDDSKDQRHTVSENLHRRKKCQSQNMQRFSYSILTSASLLSNTSCKQFAVLSVPPSSTLKNGREYSADFVVQDNSSQSNLSHMPSLSNICIQNQPDFSPAHNQLNQKNFPGKHLMLGNVPSHSSLFLAGHSRILKSWSLTCDTRPATLCDKLVQWSMIYGCACPRKPFVLKILAGEVTPPSFGSPETSMDVIRFWTVQGAATLCFRNGGLKSAAIETHKFLLSNVLKTSIIQRVNGVTHDFVNKAIISKIVKQNMASFFLHKSTEFKGNPT